MILVWMVCDSIGTSDSYYFPGKVVAYLVPCMNRDRNIETSLFRATISREIQAHLEYMQQASLHIALQVESPTIAYQAAHFPRVPA